ncbi:MAG: Spy/CpxP family protein refolding chaperone [Gemmatimonadota bacterium]
MIRILPLVATLLIGACAQIEGQQSRRSGGDSEPGPITTLLRLQDELSLTSTQVQQLRNIDDRLDQLNRPLVSRMMSIRRRIRALGPRDDISAQDRALYESYVAEARPLMSQIQQNNRTAMGEVGALLTDAQKKTIDRLLKERAARERSGGNSRSQDRRN